MPQPKRIYAKRSSRFQSKDSKAPAKGLEEFQLFPKLPRELRDMIWKESVLPQFVKIKNSSHEVQKERFTGEIYFLTVVQAEANITAPAILHVNQESRNFGLTVWSRELGGQLSKPVYFNWKADTLYMETFDAFLAFYGGPWLYNKQFGNDMARVEKCLRHLVIGEDIPRGSIPTNIISRLYNLEDLTLPRPPKPGFAAKKTQRELTEMIHAWMTEKQEMYSEQKGKYNDWMLPKIKFMPKYELASLEKVEREYQVGVQKRSEDKVDKTIVDPLRGYQSTNPCDSLTRKRRADLRNGLNRFGRSALYYPGL